jgi:hypothetical protein
VVLGLPPAECAFVAVGELALRGAPNIERLFDVDELPSLLIGEFGQFHVKHAK